MRSALAERTGFLDAAGLLASTRTGDLVGMSDNSLMIRLEASAILAAAGRVSQGTRQKLCRNPLDRPDVRSVVGG